ncbi:MAG: hypothetical protein ACFFB2_11150 [Promethearchaeota archaeon]
MEILRTYRHLASGVSIFLDEQIGLISVCFCCVSELHLSIDLLMIIPYFITMEVSSERN